MTFCKDCGHKLTKLKSRPEIGSWESRYRCDKCGLRIEVSYGDAMGGSSNVTNYRGEPFTTEEVEG